MKSAFSIEEVRQQTGLGRTSIYRAISDGLLVARKVGRRTVVLDTDLKVFLKGLPTARTKQS